MGKHIKAGLMKDTGENLSYGLQSLARFSAYEDGIVHGL
jgi:hypothetical protein